MKLSHLSDQALLQQTLLLVKREKEILSEILEHLEEVRRRRLFCDLGYGSLFQYCVKHLGYSEDQAYRRLSALKIVKEVPAVQGQIASGELTLANLCVAQALFKVESEVDKEKVLLALKNKSKRESQAIVRSFSSRLSENNKELKIILSLAQEEKWQAVKAKLSHCNLSEAEILERLCDLFLAPKPTAPRQVRSASRSAPSPATATASAPVPAPPRNPALQPQPLPTRPGAHPGKYPKTIPAPIRRKILSQGQCQNCGSRYGLEIDHKLPRSLEGTNHPSNLRLHCKPCNQRAAIQLLGSLTMQKFLEKS